MWANNGAAQPLLPGLRILDLHKEDKVRDAVISPPRALQSTPGDGHASLGDS